MTSLSLYVWYSTGNSAECSVITLMGEIGVWEGGPGEKGYIYIHMADSL